MEQIDDNHAGQDDSTPVTPVSPGKSLREARERLGLSVADVAAQTRLAPRQIEALEADDLDRLPEMPFVRGFVRNYAKILHLDAQSLLDALPQTKPAAAQLMPSSVEVPFPDAHAPQQQNLIWLGAALLLAVGVVAFAVWHYTTPVERSQPMQAQTPLPLPVETLAVPAAPVADEAGASAVSATQDMAAAALPVPAVPAMKAEVPPARAPQTPSVSSAPVSAAPAPAPVAPKPAKPAAAAGSATLRLVFGDESWVEVRDKDGDLLSSQINAGGSELRLNGNAPFTLAIGRAGSVQLYLRGKPVDLKPHISATSEVARLTVE